jgi:hypothetical protein
MKKRSKEFICEGLNIVTAVVLEICIETQTDIMRLRDLITFFSPHLGTRMRSQTAAKSGLAAPPVMRLQTAHLNEINFWFRKAQQ